jgi:hypothetical protein
LCRFYPATYPLLREYYWNSVTYDEQEVGIGGVG